MIQVVYTPQWFYSKDLLIDTISAFVLLLIASFGVRYFKLNKNNKNYLYLSGSFSLIALSFLFKILTNFTIYYKIFVTRHLGNYILTYPAIQASNILFFVGFSLYRFLTLLGLYMLYSIYQKKQSKSNIFLIVFFLVVLTYFSELEYFIFHIIAFALLALITLNYYNTYKKNKQLASKFVTASFAIIGVSQIFSIFVFYNSLYYVMAEIIQLVGYLILLITFIRVLRDAKKKR
ncbi:MAG TPA: hypothetical protein VJJ52_02020 [Candidatus Nanoarchaeia archaeon]|nr:hypothetical protein [Candidatus Nanoarchaeia archaeon]